MTGRFIFGVIIGEATMVAGYAAGVAIIKWWNRENNPRSPLGGT